MRPGAIIFLAKSKRYSLRLAVQSFSLLRTRLSAFRNRTKRKRLKCLGSCFSWLRSRDTRILEIAVTGSVFHADANLLLGDSEPLSVTYDRARRYWRGESTDAPEPEILVAGRVAVVAEGS